MPHTAAYAVLVVNLETCGTNGTRWSMLIGRHRERFRSLPRCCIRLLDRSASLHQLAFTRFAEIIACRLVGIGDS